VKNKKINISIIASKFNEVITLRLLKACEEQLLRSGVKKNNINVHWVPGSFEIPVAALKLARKKDIDCVICLGAVIRGETMHYDLVARGAAEGVPFGFAKGLGMIVPRVLVGVYEFVSAPFPAPAGYRAILKPEFPWDYFDEGSPKTSRRR